MPAIPGDLYISVDFGSSPTKDDGTRPYTGTNPQWNNFSIWLDGGPSQTETRVGAPTTVKVRVSNKGQQPVPAVKVDTYVMNPFVGIAKPNQAIERLSGSVGSVAPGSGSTSLTDAHVVTCKIQDPQQGPVPWISTQAELSATINGEGHLCVIANVYADADGHQLLDAEDFKVVDDQHQGQRNIALLPMALRAEEAQEFLIMPAPEEEETLVQFEPVEAELVFGAGERLLLLSHKDFAADRETGALAVSVDGELFPLFLSDNELRTRLFVGDYGELGLEAGDDGDGDDDKGGYGHGHGHGHGHGRGHRLPGFHDPLPSRILLESQEERIGAVHAFDIVQRDRRGRALGALRVLTVATG